MPQYAEEREAGTTPPERELRLDSIIGAFKAGESPETILRSFPVACPLLRIYGAITFYLENKDKVEAYLKDQERLWKEMTARQTDLTESLPTRLREAKETAPGQA
jgi:hypothetical protein